MSISWWHRLQFRTAIQSWKTARARQLLVWKRPDLLDGITSFVPTIGPTGTHGKTTTTAMLVLAARAVGLDPSFVVGGELVDLGTNAHRGEDPLLILEVDEAFGTFERVHLDGLVVTSVEPEHLDYFETAASHGSHLRQGGRRGQRAGPLLCRRPRLEESDDGLL